MALIYKIASTLQQREEAFKLLYQSYLDRKFIEPNRWSIRVTPYHLLPTTQTFSVYENSQVICCVTLVPDGPFGLPMEKSFPKEVNQRRATGNVLGEVTCLANKGKNNLHSLQITLKLMSLMAQFAEYNGVQELMIIAHPRHSKFYQYFTAFKLFGSKRPCSYMLNKPAVALNLDLANAPTENPIAYKKFFGNPFPEQLLKPQPITTRQQEYFRQFLME